MNGTFGLMGWVLALMLMLVVAGGCSQNITSETIRKDVSPTLETLVETSGERKNRHAKTWDVNTSQIWDDIDRILFNDRPLRMTKYPIP